MIDPYAQNYYDLFLAFITQLRHDLAHPRYANAAREWLLHECPMWFDVVPDMPVVSVRYSVIRDRLEALPVGTWFRIEDVAHLYTNRRHLRSDLAAGLRMGIVDRRGNPAKGGRSGYEYCVLD